MGQNMGKGKDLVGGNSVALWRFRFELSVVGSAAIPHMSAHGTEWESIVEGLKCRVRVRGGGEGDSTEMSQDWRLRLEGFGEA